MTNTLLTNFYIEISSTFSEQNQQDFTCVIRLNADHAVYKGHFPSTPIAPGVCLTQVIKEVLMEKFQKELIMTSGDNIKFLAMINPKETTDLELKFTVKPTEDSLDVNAHYIYSGITYVKFKGKFTLI